MSEAGDKSSAYNLDATASGKSKPAKPRGWFSHFVHFFFHSSAAEHRFGLNIPAFCIITLSLSCINDSWSTEQGPHKQLWSWTGKTQTPFITYTTEVCEVHENLL